MPRNMVKTSRTSGSSQRTLQGTLYIVKYFTDFSEANIFRHGEIDYMSAIYFYLEKSIKIE